jgi:hypothetical protein
VAVSEDDADYGTEREYLVESLRRYLLGPSTQDENFSESPLSKYLIGILYPAGTDFDSAEDDSRSDYSEDAESNEPEVTFPTTQTRKPTSIGLSCQVDPSTAIVLADVRYGLYTTKEGTLERSRTDRRETVSIDLSKRSGVADFSDGAELRWITRAPADKNSIFLTVFLVNTNKPSKKRDEVERRCIFQPVITLSSQKGVPFMHRPFERFPGSLDPDKANFDLLFRDRHEFAVGHGCSVDWDELGGARTNRIWTNFIPTYEAPKAESVQLDLEGLKMNTLADAPNRSKLRELLKPLADAYESWIAQTDASIPSLSIELQPAAIGNIERCRKSLASVREGIRLLCDDSDSFEAFRFANRAMQQQISRQILNRASRRLRARVGRFAPAITWRPFQLAFILLCIPGIVDPNSEDRRKFVDLLWFPTGGGKTEAYLGLAAFAMARRRLVGNRTNSVYDGVTIIMRYTLRLLTIQQFQRAATLMCACEVLRRLEPAKWGSEPFLLGLWVGQQATPNSYEDAVDILREQQETGITSRGTPVQLHQCPWCGEHLDAKDWWWDEERKWILASCPRRECEFHQRRVETALPILTVDDDIYHRLPSLLVSTVDKFAQIAWNPEVSAIFGRIDRKCPLHGYYVAGVKHSASHPTKGGQVKVSVERLLPPPDLIIQDELHLITGPLGTLVGLYESAIDYLCSYQLDGETIFPKVIASTATIRRASEQVSKLFARETRIFPPSGINAGDSFFAKETANAPGRMYVGVSAPGRSVKFALDWVFASLLEYAALEDAKGKPINPYWTLVGYFNSLRELGGALRLTEDDIPNLMDAIAGGTEKGRKIRIKEELTSWVPSSRIPEILDMLEEPKDSGNAVDILMATNMLSVGVDIRRLGLMVVNGQPKVSSEYIQATNRIGREYPGLIVTLYNCYRPRDMSHYERFKAYHSMLYRHVEANSVTPFAPRARDRGLTALVVGMARILDPDLTVNQQAHEFVRTKPVVKRVTSILLDRVRTVEPAEAEKMKTEIDSVWDWWEKMVRKYDSKLVYRTPKFSRQGDWQPLLRQAEQKEPQEAWGAPGSLRNVEPMANLYYQG